MDKADYLSECMSEFKGAPIDAFNREFCTLCSNRECARSWGNASVFDNRVKNWRSVLFENVQRSNNPSAANLKFEPIGSGKIPEIVSTPSFETVPSPAPDEFMTYDDVPDTDADTKEAVTPVEEQLPVRQANAPNTPFEQPVMVGGHNLKTEEAEAGPGCVFVFDDGEE